MKKRIWIILSLICFVISACDKKSIPIQDISNVTNTDKISEIDTAKNTTTNVTVVNKSDNILDSLPNDNENNLLLWGLIVVVVVLSVLIIILFCGLKKLEKKLDKERGIRKSKYISEDTFYKIIGEINKVVDEIKKAQLVKPQIVQQNQNVSSNNCQPEFVINQPKNTVTFETCLVKHFKNGEFEEVQCAIDAYYEISYISGRNTGEFEFKGDVEMAINNRDSVFEGVCDIKGNSNTAKQIKTLQKGKCERKANNKWQVTKKAIIEYLN